MSETDVKNLISKLTGEDDEDIIDYVIGRAKQAILDKAYPFRTDIIDVPKRYEYLILDIAVYLLNKQGAEGEIAHSENGVSRTYENGNIPNSFLKSIIPQGKVYGYEMFE